MAASTHNMFNFVLILYLIGFVAMVIRWRKVEFEDNIITKGDRRSDHFKSSPLQHSLVDIEKSTDAIKLNKVITIARKVPILNKNDSSLKSDEIWATNKKSKLATHSKQTKKNVTLKSNVDEKTLWKTEQTRRRNTLHQACSRYDNYGQQMNVSEIMKSHKGMFWPVIVEDKYRLLYTFVSKVGSTNWKSSFLVLKGKYKSVEDVPGRFAHSPSLIRLSTFSDEGIKRRLDNYTNFIFVRHPFARVLSAYRDKFLQPNYHAFQKSKGVQIIKMYRQNATKESLSTGKDVSFPEFIRYIVNAQMVTNGHWKPIYKMVLPCTVRFDYIGKLETGEEDAKYILQETKVDHLVHFMATKRNVSHNAAIFNHYYSQIPNGDLIKLYKVYEPDFQLFGYEVPVSMNNSFKSV